MKIREITCKSGLGRSFLPGLDYALNPYRGCEHACIYCYSPAVLGENRKWGEFVDVRINMPFILSKELKKLEKGVVGISTVTDPYQPVEKRYELTRKCLELLLKHDFPISIQTKSPLVLRDLDLFKRFSNAEVGLTITTLNDEVRKLYEPNSSRIEERLAVLEEIGKFVPTFVFLGPIMPYITDRNDDLEKLIDRLAKAQVRTLMVDRLRLKTGLWQNIQNFLLEYDATLIPKYKDIFWSRNNYFEEVAKRIENLCKRFNLKCEIYV